MIFYENFKKSATEKSYILQGRQKCQKKVDIQFLSKQKKTKNRSIRRGQVLQVKVQQNLQILTMAMSPEVKERLEVVFEVVKTTFHWSFIPAVLYLGK